MSLADLDERERTVVRECLQASVGGPFFPAWEFATPIRAGARRSEKAREQLKLTASELMDHDSTMGTPSAPGECDKNLFRAGL